MFLYLIPYPEPKSLFGHSPDQSKTWQQIYTWKNKSVGHLSDLTVHKAILSEKVVGAWCFFKSIDKSAS